jgi:hypothetical protein
MMKKLERVLVCLAILFVNSVQAQNYEWATTIGGTRIAGSANSGTSVAFDASGNVYSVGSFQGTVDFDPGTGVVNIASYGTGTNNTFYISKLDSAGNFLWAKRIGSASGTCEAFDMAMDVNGNILIAGTFSGTKDFDPNSGISNLIANGSDAFVMKMSSNGDLIWAKNFGNQANSIAIDASNNIYTTGTFSGTNQDFDPGVGSLLLNSVGSTDIFVSKLDANGNLVLAFGLGQSSGDDNGISICLSGNSHFYITGTFKNTLDVDPSAGVFNLINLTSRSTYLVKYTLSGVFVWGKQFDNLRNPKSIIADAIGNVYATGDFNNPIDFDPGIAVATITPIGTDAFILKLNSDGNYLWAKRFMNSTGNSMGFDAFGNLVTVGIFNSNPTDFDPGTGVFSLSCSGGDDVFLSVLTATGNFVSALRVGNSGNDGGNCVAIDAIGNIAVTGFFSGTVDFDPGVGLTNVSSSLGAKSVSLWKLNASKNFRWARTFGGTRVINMQCSQNAVTTDALGNVYTTGYFSGTVDFDPGANTTILNSGSDLNMFIMKNNPSGNLLWVKNIGNGNDQENGVSLTCDANNALYIVGTYNGGPTDFDPGTGVFNLTQGSNDVGDFILKLDLNGNFVWAKNCVFNAVDVKTDATGNVFVAGHFNQTSDFDPGTGVFSMTALNDNDDVCVLKLNSSGNFLSAFKLGGTQNDVPSAMDLDASGNIYLSGTFNGTSDFDPGAGTVNLVSAGSQDAFVCKLTGNGTYVWAYKFGQSTGDDDGIALSVGNSGFVHYLGVSKGTIDVDPGAGVVNISSIDPSTYILKLNLNGTFLWVKQLNNVPNPKKIQTDGIANAYVTGHFSGTKDFDPGLSTFNLSSAGSDDVFVLKLDNNGLFSWAKKIGGSSNEIPVGFRTHGNGITYTCGYYSSTGVDFDPGTGVSNKTRIGSQDGFLQKLSPDGVVIVPQINISASQTTLCPTTTQITYTATAVTGDPNQTYQWKKNGVNVGTNSAVYVNTAPLSGDVVYCVLTSTGFTVNSNSITLSSSTFVTPSVVLAASQTAICFESTEVDYIATVQNGGASPVYQWYLNGSQIVNSGSVYSETLMSVGDQVYVVVTSNASCASPGTVTSNTITLTLTSTNFNPSISITSSQNTVCGATTSIVYSATALNFGPAPMYQWYKNGLPVGISDLTYINNTPSAGDTVYCVLTSNASCIDQLPTTSNIIILNSTATNVTPSLSIVASQSTICAATTQVVYTATAMNAGTNPVYQWYKNGLAVGANSPMYTLSSPASGNAVYCVMTSNASCVSPTTATSNTITLSFTSASVAPSLSIVASQSTICAATTQVVYTATATSAGTNPVYQWYKNGVTVGANSPIYTLSSPASGNAVYCVVTSNASCVSPTTATSNTITLSFTATTIVPSVSLASSPGASCITTGSTFTATPTNGGTNPTYVWKKNGVVVGSNSSTYTDAAFSLTDFMTVDLQSNASCLGSTTMVTGSFSFTNILTWTGAVDADWHKACNWSPQVVPQQCNSVVIPFTANQPVVSQVAACKDISVYTTNGALLTVNNTANLQIETCPLVATENACP